MIVPYPPGGPMDAMACIVTQKLSDAMGARLAMTKR
jgi:tripartite-type tricarboxylate transporter receptor subunit TctC